jgi:hypothetical protein
MSLPLGLVNAQKKTQKQMVTHTMNAMATAAFAQWFVSANSWVIVTIMQFLQPCVT